MMKPLVKRAVAARRLRARRLPALRASAADGTATVYYLCPDFSVPSGGIRAIYRHVDLLNAEGVPAAVLHHKDGFACTWFEHRTRIASASSVCLGRDDVLVVPEIYGPFLDELPAEPRLVAFNQNAYLTFDRVPSGRRVPYERFAAALTVSNDSADYLRFAFPGLPVSVASNAIDPSVFRPADAPPGRRIAVMPRKRPDDANQVLRLLGDRLRDWEVVTIAGGSERDTAAAMRGAPVFLAFGHQEGFGLPPAEAMASGCFVIGFPGFGGREIFDPAFSIPIEDGDVLAFARAVADTLERFERDPGGVREAGLRASEHVRRTYPLDRQRTELLSFMEDVRACA